MNLDKHNPSLKTGNEKLTLNGIDLPFNLIDFGAGAFLTFSALQSEAVWPNLL